MDKGDAVAKCFALIANACRSMAERRGENQRDEAFALLR
jgi:hypothetical protein